MRAVDVGVGHHDDLVIAQFADVENSSRPMPVPSASDQRADLLGREHLVEARALDVENFTAQWQHGLEFAVAALLGGAAGGITLDDEQFGLRRIAFLTVREFAGQRGDVERALAAGEIARLARGFARGCGFHHLADDGLGFAGMFLKPRTGECCVQHGFSTTGRTSEDTSLSLVCDENFGSGTFHRKHSGEAFAAVVAGQRDLFLLGGPMASA